MDGRAWLSRHIGARWAIGLGLLSTVLAMFCVATTDWPFLLAGGLLAVFGVGGLLLQYPVGWLVDRRGLRLITVFLTLAITASTLTDSSMAANVSLISMFYTLSAVAGPLAAGALISATNGNALMWFAAALASLMALAMLIAV